jgi:Ca2+-binding RTX toxin-like protein
MPVSPPIDPPAIVPNYWSYTTLSFNRSQAYPGHPEYGPVFPNDLNVYDINGDGHLDILQVYAYIPAQDIPGTPIRVLLGDGHGHFTDGTASLFPSGAPLGDAATGSTVADFNGDGVLDIFIGMTWETTFEIQRHDILLLSDGHGGVVDASSTLPGDVNDYTHWTAGADIDGDGDVDLFACNIGIQGTPNGDLSSHFLINDGTGHFVRSDTRLPATVETGDRMYISSLLFDADNDGDADLLLGIYGPQAVLMESGASSSLLLFNDGTGNFLETAGSNLPAPLFGADVAVMNDMDTTDLNGDGYADLVMLTGDFYTQYGIQVLINNGDGTFRDETQSRLPLSESLIDGTNYNARYLHLTDINADGALDLVLQTGGPNRFYLNDGTGYFVALPDDFLFAGAASGGYGFVPGDFNEDGRTDFFVRTIVNSWDDPNNVTEFDWIALWNQPAGTVLSGNDAANAVLGTVLAETLSGLGGDDVLSGGAGADQLFGGLGNDTLMGGAGNDTMRGDEGNDTYVVTDAGDVVIEGSAAGTDIIRSSVSATLGANVENLTLTGAAALNGNGNGLANDITGNSGANHLDGGDGDDRLSGNGGDDVLAGGGGIDVLDGEEGSDVYVIASVADHAAAEIADSGADGADELRFTATTASTLKLFAHDSGLERIVAGGAAALNIDASALSYAVGIVGNGGANVLIGGIGGDTIAGGAGADRLEGRAGNDALEGGAGGDAMYGGTGNDSYVIHQAADQAFENAGEGTDTILASISQALGANIENLTLTGAASLQGTGNELANVVTGNAGANTLLGMAGSDTLIGGGGNDRIDGGAGSDHLSGGNGNDVYVVDKVGDVVTEVGGEGIDLVESAVSYALSNNVERLVLTGTAASSGTGNALGNAITGNSAANLLVGELGADTLRGGDGADTLQGGDGNDWLYGGTGRDICYGGAGTDHFAFADGDFGGASSSTCDRIVDFDSADIIQLVSVDAITTADGDQHFAFVGTAGFSGVAGELRYQQISGNTYVQGDLNGDGAADFWIRVDGLHTLTSGDFVL